MVVFFKKALSPAEFEQPMLDKLIDVLNEVCLPHQEQIEPYALPYTEGYSLTIVAVRQAPFACPELTGLGQFVDYSVDVLGHIAVMLREGRTPLSVHGMNLFGLAPTFMCKHADQGAIKYREDLSLFERVARLSLRSAEIQDASLSDDTFRPAVNAAIYPVDTPRFSALNDRIEGAYVEGKYNLFSNGAPNCATFALTLIEQTKAAPVSSSFFPYVTEQGINKLAQSATACDQWRRAPDEPFCVSGPELKALHQAYRNLGDAFAPPFLSEESPRRASFVCCEL
jgi:hypothetical protein